MEKFITKRLNEIGVTWKKIDDKIIISDEFQEEHYNPDIDMDVPYFLTEWNYPCSLNKELSKLNETLDSKYGKIFECDYPGTFVFFL